MSILRALFRVLVFNAAKWADWKTRWPELVALVKRQRCSLLLITECSPEFARLLALALGWTSSKGDECWVIGPNRNGVVWNPRKWWLRSATISGLSAAEGDAADVKNRAAVWVLLQHRLTGLRLWAGATHLSPNAGRSQAAGNAQRVAQAAEVVAGVPQDAPVLLGIDRNCNPGSDPEKVLSKHLALLTDVGDTLASRPGVQELDAAYTTRPKVSAGIRVRRVVKVLTRGATDHNALRLYVTLTSRTSTL